MSSSPPHSPAAAEALRRLVQKLVEDVRPLGFTLRELVLSAGDTENVAQAPAQVIIYGAASQHVDQSPERKRAREEQYQNISAFVGGGAGNQGGGIVTTQRPQQSSQPSPQIPPVPQQPQPVPAHHRNHAFAAVPPMAQPMFHPGYYQAPYYHHLGHPPNVRAFPHHPIGPQNMFWSTVLGGEHAHTPSMQPPISNSVPQLHSGEQDKGTTQRTAQPPSTKHVTAEQPGGSRDTAERAETEGVKSPTAKKRRAVSGRPSAQFRCPRCDAPFGQRSNLNKHVRTVHENQRPFQCEKCASAFGHKNLLIEHIRTAHNRERPFACDRCDVTFGRKSNLYQHVQMVHENKRNFACHVCKMSFGLKGNLNKHIRTVHEKQRPYACDSCTSSFGLKSDLKRHKTSVHGVSSSPSPSGASTAPHGRTQTDATRQGSAGSSEGMGSLSLQNAFTKSSANISKGVEGGNHNGATEAEANNSATSSGNR